jgi:hypothetical protein
LQFNLFEQRSRDLLIPGANILEGECSGRDRQFGRWKFNTWNADCADYADFFDRAAWLRKSARGLISKSHHRW